MSTIPSRFMNELRDRLSLSDVIGRRVKLTRAGREFKACCPFHREKSPSFYVNDDKQFFHCFGCGAHGDVIGFAMRHDNLSFIEAVEALAAQAGMQVPEQSPEAVAQAHREKSLYALMDEATSWFQKKIYEAPHIDALTYMKERGISDELMASFRIGFAPADGQALPRYLKGQGFSEAQMIEAGVVRSSKRDGQPYSFFRDRVMFPIPDRRGRVVAFGGRVLPEHLRPIAAGESKPPKYINSAETSLFRKGEMLYGEPHARQAAIDALPLIVVEGYLDVMAAFDAGYRGALAPLGTALTERQIAALWKMIPGDQKAPILCFDGDDAGRRAAARVIDHILPMLKPDHSVRIAFLPDGQDPDSLIKAQGKTAFDTVIESAMPLVEFIWLFHTAGKRFDTPEERAGLAQTLENEALRVPDRNVQHYYRDALRQKLRTAFGSPAYNKRAGGAANVLKNNLQVGIPLRRPAFSEDRMAVQILLACVLNHPALFDEVDEELGSLDMGEGRFSSLRQAIIQIFSKNQGLNPLDSGALMAHLISEGFETELESVLSEAVYTHAGFAKPQTELDIVRKGWQDTVSIMQRKTMVRELGVAGRALKAEFSDENEQRVMALHRSSRSSGEHQN